MSNTNDPLGFDGPHVSVETQPAPAIAPWRNALPLLRSDQVTVRELIASDAEPLCDLLSSDEVARYIPSPPTTVEGFVAFIEWTHRERRAGRQACFGIVVPGADHAVGVIQLREVAPPFALAEWGFALGSRFWGTGAFIAAARAVLDFAFDQLGVHRLEARATVENARGNAALRKLGATSECVMRGALLKDGKYLDQVLWSIVRA
jgi:ribosomal-protein-alanine N-acetyltransferase